MKRKWPPGAIFTEADDALLELDRPAPTGAALVRNLEENLAAARSLQVRLPWLEAMLGERLAKAVAAMGPRRMVQLELFREVA